MTLGVLLTIGESITGLRASGQEQRFVREYLRRYARVFDRVVVFSYAHERIALPEGVVLIPNRFRIHRFLYAILLPILHARTFRAIDVLRVMQAPGAIPAWVARHLFETPYVVTYGYEYERLARFEGKRLRALLLRIILHPLLNAASAVIVTSRARIRDLTDRGIHNVTLIPNGVDPLSFFSRQSPAPSRPIRILYVGRLEREKNLPLLIDALSTSRYRKDAELVFVGSGSMTNSLRLHAEQRGVRLRLAGIIPHHKLPDIYRNVDLFALLSVSEGHPKALLEALMSGLPCVVTRPVAEAVGLTEGKNGRIVEPVTNAVQTTIDELLGNAELRERLGRAARAFAETHLDIRSMLEKEITLLHHHARTHS